MEKDKIINALQNFEGDDIDLFAALSEIFSEHHDSELGFAHIDHRRSNRCGFPEFVYGEGKTTEHLRQIVTDINTRGDNVLVTRLQSEQGCVLQDAFSSGSYCATAKAFTIINKEPTSIHNVYIMTAGTTDLPVAHEAQHTLLACGYESELISDVGVAGIHRLLSKMERLRSADVVIVAAGMEGALPSVVAGLVSCPIIAVPTSVGYGTSLGGITPLLAMLNSCGSGVSVVNIDNGFGAACSAARILNRHQVSGIRC